MDQLGLHEGTGLGLKPSQGTNAARSCSVTVAMWKLSCTIFQQDGGEPWRDTGFSFQEGTPRGPRWGLVPETSQEPSGHAVCPGADQQISTISLASAHLQGQRVRNGDICDFPRRICHFPV